ncbi:MAG: flagellin hook IN motif-containing protein [Alphaproteobacteria bacterium]|jgi:flagellin-like hook-associated protein FlgL|nr:flagellin hook IN motif-containing protein [Alphaproteobacteria bacterium]MDP7223057.1 flagellin hook IN motif-containing protein [Alphaproteobacteria bacterium]
MSSDVVLSSALRSNLLTLQNTQNQIDRTQFRLATGKKVNSALDNPQNFFTAQSIGNRANDLSRLLDGIGQSIRAIEAADNGVSALTGLLEQADSIATQAQSQLNSASSSAVAASDSSELDGTNASKALQAETTVSTNDAFSIAVGEETAETFTISDTTTLNSLVSEINDRASAEDKSFRASITSEGQLQISSTNGERLTLDDTTGTALNDLGVIESASAAETFLPGGSLEISLSGTGTIDENTDLSSLTEFTGFDTTSDTLTISVDGAGTTTILIGDSGTGPQTIDDLIDAINEAGVDGGNLEGLTASFDDSNDSITITADSAEIDTFELTSNDGSAVDLGEGQNTSGTATIFRSGSGASANDTLTDLASDFNEIRSQINSIVDDANYRGTNLLSGDDLITTFNEDGSSTLTTEGVTFTASGLGVSEADFTSASTIQASVDDIESALSTVRRFGNTIANDLSIIQTRQDFTQQSINTLEAGRDDLIVADQNEEGANLLALQTRQQLGVTSLSLAAQSQQAVLRLF